MGSVVHRINSFRDLDPASSSSDYYDEEDIDIEEDVWGMETSLDKGLIDGCSSAMLSPNKNGLG